MNNRLIFGLSLFVACGCASTGVTRAPDRDLSRIKNVYLVNQDDTELNRLLEDALAAKGLTVGAGSDAGVSPQAQAIVTYNYNRHWDMGTYLEYFEVELRDPRTKSIIVRAEAHHPTWERQSTSDEVQETVGHLLAGN